MLSNHNIAAHIKRVQHATAKRLKLTVRADHIRLTVPKHCPEALIQQFLVQSQDWLEKAWQQQLSRNVSEVKPPTHIHLFNLNMAVQVCVTDMAQLYRYEPTILYISASTPFKALKAFLLDYAGEHLSAYLKTVSAETGLSYGAVQVRFVKTRWGSCNTQHKIMLNATLVLLDQSLVRAVCIHELAHTKVFNHSTMFWQTVAQFDPNYLNHHEQMKQNTWPSWVNAMLNHRE
ncbi:YgjP family zinc-dependent metalloprotease [Acinetobacter rathckeae]|uniref:YgjP family zinc-dependent metalloprotease n=1 Tax=Acinetobacter rathckeae TaxID=2605272 RepID=UPI0018A2AD57|nr:SprT family zinc-dependent metalloprotease [Acinetobacter rathckeae]MBF7687684.1 M48 family metallopeptidase [Acinetobacter rathckeae]MBF7695086.1 M48 family metallopeptidase [Acinetobacter rathckeae]